MLKDDRKGRGSGAAMAVGLVLLGVMAATPAQGQEGAMSLTLDEAIDLARENNPTFLSTANDMGQADWAVREAYANFLPSFTTASGASYTAPGVQRIGTITFDQYGGATTDYYVSWYSMNLNYQFSGQTLFQARSARADRTATEARIQAAEFTLESGVTAQYLLALMARDGVAVVQEQLGRAEQNYQLARARVDAGAAIPNEARQMEVERGRAQVAVIQAENLLRAEKLRLREQIGVPLDQEIALVTEVGIFEPEWSREELLSAALGSHPQLRSFEAAENARRADLRQAQSAYLPSLSASANWSGFNRETGNVDLLLGSVAGGFEYGRQECEKWHAIAAGLSNPVDPTEWGEQSDCSTLVMTPEYEQALIEGNDVFPFRNMERSPLSLNFQISLPIFQGFTRQRQVEQARNATQDAMYSRRAEELRISTAVNQALDDLEAAYQAVAIEERNREVASEQLELARERYRLGAAAFLELLEAETSMATAERDYLNALYTFHGAMWSLESATGLKLRPESTGY